MLTDARAAMKQSISEWYKHYETEMLGSSSERTEIHIVKNKILIISQGTPVEETFAFAGAPDVEPTQTGEGETDEAGGDLMKKALSFVTRCEVVSSFTAVCEVTGEKTELYTLDCNLENILETPHQLGD